MTMSSSETLSVNGKRYYRIVITLLEMLKDRGYDVSDSEVKMTPQQFLKQNGSDPTRESLTFYKQRPNDLSDRIMVAFPKDAKIGMKNINEYMDKTRKGDVNKVIVVTVQKISAIANSSINEHGRLVQENELLFNCYKHVLVPKHEVLTGEEKKTLLERYTMKESQLPRMQVEDPISRYFGLERGQVMKIIRPSETAGKYVTYRIVF